MLSLDYFSFSVQKIDGEDTIVLETYERSKNEFPIACWLINLELAINMIKQRKVIHSAQRALQYLKKNLAE